MVISKSVSTAYVSFWFQIHEVWLLNIASWISNSNSKTKFAICVYPHLLCSCSLRPISHLQITIAFLNQGPHLNYRHRKLFELTVFSITLKMVQNYTILVAQDISKLITYCECLRTLELNLSWKLHYQYLSYFKYYLIISFLFISTTNIIYNIISFLNYCSSFQNNLPALCIAPIIHHRLLFLKS